MYRLITFSILLTLLFGCEKVTVALKEEFDSEKAPSTIAYSPTTPYGQDQYEKSYPITSSSLFLMRGNNLLLTPIDPINNTYKLEIEYVGDTVVTIGGTDSLFSKTMNNLIFFNEWDKDSLRVACLTLFQDVSHVPNDVSLNLLVTKPSYNVTKHSASFVVIFDLPPDLEYLRTTLASGMLCIKFYRQRF